MHIDILSYYFPGDLQIFPIGFVESESGFIVRSVETGLGR